MALNGVDGQLVQYIVGTMVLRADLAQADLSSPKGWIGGKQMGRAEDGKVLRVRLQQKRLHAIDIVRTSQ